MHSLILLLNGFIFCNFFTKLYALELIYLKVQIPIKRGEFFCALDGNKWLQLFGFYNCLIVGLNVKRTNFENSCF